MNKYIFMMLIALGFSSTYSQSIEHWGIKSGVSFSSQTLQSINSPLEVSPLQAGRGIDAGVFAEIYFDNNLAVVPELSYVNKGFLFSSFYMGSNKQNPSTYYLSIPINMMYLFNKSVMELYLFCGPRIDVLVRHTNISDYYKKDINSIDLGANLGFGIRTKKILGIGTGFELTFSPDFTNSYSNDYSALKNYSFQLLFVFYN
jgi:Outer membrane protein beta-barrel domain